MSTSAGSAEDWDRKYGGTGLVWTATANRFLVEQIGDLPPGRALDLATGEGRNAVWLAERGWRVTAVDFSTVGIDKGRRLAAERGVAVDWVVADITEWRPPAHAFNLVAVLYVHLPPPQRRTLHQRAAAAVAPGGVLLVVGHDRDNPARGVGGPQDADILLTSDAVSADLDRSGLVVETARQVDRPVEVDGQQRTAIDCLVRAHRPPAAR